MEEREFVYPAVLAFGYDGGRLWVANFVGLSGCWVEGCDKDDVVRRAPAVLAEYVKSCREADWPIPEPPTVEELEAADVGEIIMVHAAL